METSSNAEIGLVLFKEGNYCQMEDGEKSYFLLLLEEQHKHRISEQEAERQTDSLKVTQIHI